MAKGLRIPTEQFSEETQQLYDVLNNKKDLAVIFIAGIGQNQAVFAQTRLVLERPSSSCNAESWSLSNELRRTSDICQGPQSRTSDMRRIVSTKPCKSCLPCIAAGNEPSTRARSIPLAILLEPR